jgi:hypothetical protein
MTCDGRRVLILIDVIVTIGNTLSVDLISVNILVPRSTPETRPNEITIIVVLIALLLLLPPIVVLWSYNDSYWLVPYLIWSIIILLSYWLQRHLKKHAL